MNGLLQQKIEEKEHFQRKCWSMEEEFNVANAMTKAAKASEVRAKEEKTELYRINVILHTTLKTRQMNYGRVGAETQTDPPPKWKPVHFSRRKKPNFLGSGGKKE